jgi:hypothetical protein
MANGVVTWPLGAIDSGTDGQVQLTLEAAPGAKIGALILTEASLTDDAGDEARASDTRIVNSSPSIAYNLQSSNNNVVPAQQIEFELTATNVGTTSYSPYLSFTVPEYTTYSSYDAYPAGSLINIDEYNAIASGSSSLISIPLTVTSGTAAPPPGAIITVNVIDQNGASISDSIAVESSLPPAPVITSAVSASGTQGEAFSYAITASGNPASFGEIGLPSNLGLVLDPGTGLLSGTPQQSGTFTATISAASTSGTGTAGLTLYIAPASYTVSPSAGANGSISPNTGQTVTSGERLCSRSMAGQ